MEELLLQIVKEANGTKLMNLKNAAQIAHDKLFRQHGVHRDPSYELRAVCLSSMQMALETRRPKFMTMALNGIHRIIKDERFYIGLEPEDDSLWLPAQLLRSTFGASALSTPFNEDTIVNILRLFLSMACSNTCTLNGRLLIEILSRCGECWETGSRAVKAASLAAASQCLRTFCVFLKEEAEEIARTTSYIRIGQASAVYNEVIPVMQWLCSRLLEPKVGSPKKNDACGSLFLTECILTLATALPRDVQTNPHFTAFLWQKFCPTLAAALGSPGRLNLDKKFTYKDALHIIENEARGFFTSPGLDGPQARCIYLTGIQLLRIAGAQASLRPMLEALFHRMLLLPAPQNRTEPLRCVKEIFKTPDRLVDLAVILYVDKNHGQNCSDDMALFRLIIDAMEECSNTQHTASCENALQSSVECIVKLLASLQTLCSGDVDESVLSNQAVETINLRYSTLREADYSGPLTYQSMARLPAPYRDAVAELRQNGFETTSSWSDSDVEQADVEIASNDSGDTEGPEEDNPSSIEDDLSTSKTDGTSAWPYSHLEAPTPVRSDGDCDRLHAREFAKQVTSCLVPKLLHLRTSVEVDECMQEFASSICQENSMNYSDFDYNMTAINADGIYLATYSALFLGLQLMRAGHYNDPEESVLVPLSEQQFVTSVQNAGVLVYLSNSWLCELYQSVIATNPLHEFSAVYGTDDDHCALVDMLCDAGGFGGNQMLSDWYRLQTVTKPYAEDNKRRDAAKKLSRRLLTCCWDSMVAILSEGLGETTNGPSTKNKLVALSKKTLKIKNNKQKHCGEALYALSLDGLHAAATLSNSLNLQHLAGKILTLIAANVCQTSGPRLSASQALSMDVVLTGGLDLGAVSSDCWLPVFSVCRHVTQLEHELFSMQNGNNVNTATTASGGRDYETGEKTSNPISAGTGSDKLNLTSCPIEDDETCVDVYSFLQAPLQTPTTNVAQILKLYTGTNESHLSQPDTAKVLCALSHQADNLFTDAAERLSLPALLQFLRNLSRASRDQLYKKNLNVKRSNKVWWPRKQRVDSLPMSLLLHRTGDVTLRVFRSSRPLLHILKVWAITGPHLMDAACHKDRTISKRAIEYIHDVITALLVEQSELAHFHFNEALLKPFENLLSMESCDIDVQDQIVACLYEVVEAHRTEIRSGWRPLFGTLRNARNRPLNVGNITDIFRVFLDSDNTLVFANAGLDCILCLLSYLEISGGGTVDDGENNNFRPMEFLHETLKFLERCSSILAFMYNMPQCPNFHSTYKIKGITYTHIIDANIPNSMENFTYFGNDYLQNTNELHMISYRSLNIDKETIVKIDELDKPSGVLKVWFLLLDGLTNSLIVCPVQHQAPILQTILKLFKCLHSSPGIDFGFYCINHLLIPMIQDWLRYINKMQLNWATMEKNFKHCCGITTDLVVEFIERSYKNDEKRLFSNAANNIHSNKPMKKKGDNSPLGDAPFNSTSKLSPAGTLALKQLLLVLIECGAQAQESVARVGVSCLKHVVLTTGHLFNEDQWMIACSAIHRACTVSVAPLRQLSFAFNEKSHSFYGDCATVKVAARRDTTLDELARISSLAQQVFLLDNQRDAMKVSTTEQLKHATASNGDDRSYSFLLYPLCSGFSQNNAENFVIRIPYKNLVVGLLANQMLLQLVAKLLLAKLNCVPPAVHMCIFDNYATTRTDNISVDYDIGFRPKEILLRCLKQYLTCSLEFDSRPGLKFLMQKVANIEVAANLYKQMTSSWMVYFIVLVDHYLSDIKAYELTIEDLQFILQSCSRLNTSTVKKKENFVRYLFALQDVWNLVCELYLSHSNGSGNNEDETNGNTMTTISEDSAGEKRAANSEDASDENNITMHSLIQSPRTRLNPFDRAIKTPDVAGADPPTVPPEIEQQRAASILKDTVSKRSSLSQLVVASMELLSTLSMDSAEYLRLLMTPTIREAFRLVQLQGNELKVNQF